MAGPRSYGDPCGIARALDVIGERWALLLVRELLLGPKRFTDLRAGLPGASPNVLSQRLRDLEEAGVIERRRLDPPAAIWVYALTARGEELEELVLALSRWGTRTAVPSSAGRLGVDAMMIALRTTFDPAATEGLGATFGLRIDDERFRARVEGGRLTLERGRAPDADATLACDTEALHRLVFAGRRMRDAEEAGELRITGDRRAAARFLKLFPGHPEPG
jgi:DNA-binding HxlR family transcriptional regulator